MLLLPGFAHAQLRDDFADGNFTANPAWTGDAASFQVTAQQLQSNGPATTGTQLQLSTPCQANTGTVWEFWANLKLATSSTNLADVWLIASQTDLKSPANSGYFVRLGGTDDEVSLFRKDSTRSPVLVIDGLNNTLASTTNNLVRVRVTRSTANRWTLERDLTGGRTFVAEAAQPTDATYQRSVAVGMSLLYSSANSRNFYFDDFAVTDATAPLLLRAQPLDARRVNVLFNEPVAAASAALRANYRLQSGAVPATAQVLATNPAVVQLTFAADVAPTNVLEARNIADLYGNVAAGPLTATFSAPPALPQVGDLLITEIFADETPQVGLPLSEYVEIYNRSARVLNLGGVRFTKPGSTTAAVLPDTARLLPGQYAIVCGSTRVLQFVTYGKVYGPTNFPTLNNGGDQLVLRSRDGRTLFEVSYSDTWYRDARKKDGGWSLEMIDANNYCAGASNWTASTDPTGGTPGRANSVRAANADALPPSLLRAVALAPNTVRLYFSEKLDSAAAATLSRYALPAPGPAVTRAAPVAPDFRQVDLTLAAPLQPSRATTLTVQTATDCAGNASGPLQSARFALPEPAAPGDVVVNEVLFNPRVGGTTFVELLNRSQKYVNLQNNQFTNGLGISTSTRVITTAPYVLGPGELVAITPNADVLSAQYPTSFNPEAVLVGPLPTLDDKASSVILLDARGNTLDQFAYNKTMHLSLLATQEGVSLERIRANGPSLGSNFHSAAGAVGYATPGRTNSQAQDAPGGNQELTVEPEVFTPDDDGQQDFVTLSYHLDQPGYAASVTVYDALGRLTRRLVRNETVPTDGFFRWDGLDDRGRKATVGYYVLLVELFRAGSGEKREYKKTVVLGARF
ncbi:Lamin Tail Domain [Hymenobacter arizonensis]|uniref:Lamin Tail Domain n=1 Tax=Hymenobacter arizonensis TaxID=1227077 RepID=A0A1I5WW03_HYMAR|nr:Lamin Tail Domain [Hymenobacter arizonensis]